jgi:hypothetical protein
MVPLAAGIVVVAIAGAAAFKVMSPKAAAATDTTHVVAAGAGAGAVPAARDTLAGVEQISKPGQSKPGPSATAAAPDFDRLETLAKDSVTAARALAQVAGIHASSDEMKVRIAYVRYLAKLSLSQADACSELKAVSAIAPNTTKASVVATNLSETCSD